jgi:drug/metabolite transporter (DMT)-like permease
MNTYHRAPAWIAAAPHVFVVMWATGFVVARLSAGHVEPFTFLALRFPIAFAAFVVIALIAKAPWPSGSQSMHAAVAGGLMHAGYLGPVYWAVANGMPAGVSALIVGLQPLITAFFAAALLGEKISDRHWLGLLVGIAGVAMVLQPKLTLSGLQGVTPATTSMVLFGTLCVSLGTVYQKRFAASLPLATGGVWQYAGASLVMLACATLFESFGFDGSMQAWVALGWSVIVLSIGAILLLMLLIRHGDVGRVSSYIFLVPAVAALMSWVLFGETLTVLQIAGMAVCAAAVLVVVKGGSNR